MPSKLLLLFGLVTVATLGVAMVSEPANSQTAENTTIINATTLPNGTTQLNGTSVPEQNMSAVCSMPIFRNSDMCTQE